MTDKFTWSDLKPGMLVELRNGLRRIVLPLANGSVYLGGIFGQSSDEYCNDLYYKNNPVPDEEHEKDIVKVYGLQKELELGNDCFTIHARELLWTSLREGRVFDFFKFVRWALDNPEEFSMSNYTASTKYMIPLHGKVVVFVPGDDTAKLPSSVCYNDVLIRREWTVASKDELEGAGEECEK